MDDIERAVANIKAYQEAWRRYNALVLGILPPPAGWTLTKEDRIFLKINRIAAEEEV